MILEFLLINSLASSGTSGTGSGGCQKIIGAAEKWKICIRSVVASPEEGR
jgi:hypothetical protein